MVKSFRNKIINNVLFINLVLSVILIIVTPFIIFTSIIISSQLSDNDNNPVDTSPGVEQQDSSFTLVNDSSEISIAQIVAVGSFGIMLNSIYCIFSFNLYKFFDEVSKGDAFELKNITRLRVVSITIILTSVMFILYNNVFTKVFDGLSKDLPGWDVTFLGIVLGAVVLVISEAFYQGYELKKEQSLTI